MIDFLERQPYGHQPDGTMLTCIPNSLCSWDFRVSGTYSGPAELTFNFCLGKGSISLGGIEFRVCKHGIFRGHWTLERGKARYAHAHKPNAMFRAFLVRCGTEQHTVKAHATYRRCYDMLRSDSVVGTIRPVHPFTRSALIDCSSLVSELAQLFSFWLVVINWRLGRLTP